MSIGNRLVALVLLLSTATAQAHAHLTRSDPAEGSRLPAPARIVLDFSEAARLTSLTLQRESAEPGKLALPADAAARLSIPLPHLSAGSYTLRWRALGTDGHITSGVVHFSVLETGTAPSEGPRPR